jgi:hypothetical protein
MQDNEVILGIVVVALMIGAQSVQAFKGTSRDGYDAGYFAAKAGKPYPFDANFTKSYRLGYDFGYRDGVQNAPYDPVKKYENKDSEQEDGLPYDAQGRACLFGPDHDQCLVEYLESIPGITNNIDHLSGFKAGYYFR